MSKNAYGKLLAEYIALKKEFAEYKREQAYRELAIRKGTMQQMIDFMNISLGRKGLREKRLVDFETTFNGVVEDYSKLFVEDAKIDDELWYSKAKMDEELKEYCGSRFEPYDKRYYE